MAFSYVAVFRKPKKVKYGSIFPIILFENDRRILPINGILTIIIINKPNNWNNKRYIP